MTLASNSAAFVIAPILDIRDGKLVAAMQDAYRDCPSLGVYLLVGALRSSGRSVDVIDWVANSERTFDEIVEQCSNYAVIFLSANSMNWAVIRMLGIRIKEKSPITRLVVGGPHPTMYPESVARANCFDFLFRGEADRWIQQIYDEAHQPSNVNIPGMIRMPNGLMAAPIVQEIDLDSLNWNPAFDLLPPNAYCVIPVETSRGCKFQCSFCSIPAKKNWRGQSAATAVQRILLASEYLPRTNNGVLSIIDDTFTTDHERILQIAHNLPGWLHRTLAYDATLVDMMDERIVEALAPYTRDLLLGAEVTNRPDAKRIRKAATPAVIHTACKNLVRYGINDRAILSFIIGFPWQNLKECRSAVEFIVNLILEYGIRVYLQWYWPMPGSEIWATLENEGKVSIEMADSPGFYRDPEWFFSTKIVTLEDVREIDSLMDVVQLLLTIKNGTIIRAPLEYSPPDLEARGWISRKNPFLFNAAVEV